MPQTEIKSEVGKLLEEIPLTLEQAADHIPGATASSVRQWAKAGWPAPDGTRIKLATYRAGKKIFTTLQACGRFVADCSDYR